MTAVVFRAPYQNQQGSRLSAANFCFIDRNIPSATSFQVMVHHRACDHLWPLQRLPNQLLHHHHHHFRLLQLCAWPSQSTYYTVS